MQLGYCCLYIKICNNIAVDPQLIFLRELVILNGCEGSQAAFKIDASTSLSMTFKRWVNIYIIAKLNVRQGWWFSLLVGTRLLFPYSVCHKYTRSCVSFTVLHFLTGGGKTVVHYYYNCIIKLKG